MPTIKEIERLEASNAELLAALEDMTTRFETCVVMSGTDPEFAREATSEARIIMAKVTDISS